MIKPRYRVLRARNFARLESKVQAAMDAGAALIGGPYDGLFTDREPLELMREGYALNVHGMYGPAAYILVGDKLVFDDPVELMYFREQHIENVGPAKRTNDQVPGLHDSRDDSGSWRDRGSQL